MASDEPVYVRIDRDRHLSFVATYFLGNHDVSEDPVLEEFDPSVPRPHGEHAPVS